MSRETLSLIFIVDHRTPDHIYVDGKTVPVQFLQFQLADLLAQHPGVCVSYENVYRELWGKQNRIVEPAQIHYQLRQLRKTINESAEGWTEVIKTIPKRGLQLNLAPDQVLIMSQKS